MSLKHTFKTDPHTKALQLGGSNKLRVDRNRAYLCIVLLLICVLALVFATAVLAKIHTVVPVIAVIDANGHVVTQTLATPKSITGQESFVESQIHDFIVDCNTFDLRWRQYYSDKCHLHSDKTVANQYDLETSPDNKDNPYYAIGEKGRRYPIITAINKLGAHSYQVEFKSVTENSSSDSQTEYYTALVGYSFTYHPLALGDRWENPLGFIANSYHKNQEKSLTHKG